MSQPLDKFQKAAVETTAKRVMVSACPGSGKSRVITERAKHLANEMGVDPSDILLLTFTRAGANVMRSRMGKIGRRLAFSGSFHAYLLRLVQEGGNALGWEPEWMTLLDEDEAKEESTEALSNAGLTGRDGQFKLAPKACKALWSQLTRGYGQQEGVDYPPELVDKLTAAFSYYRNRLLSENSMTFDLLVQDGLRLVKPLPNAHALLDECFRGDALISMSDGSRRTIREIVEGRVKGNVLSLDRSSGEVVSRRITGWRKVPRNGRCFVRIGSAMATPEHPVLTENGWRELRCISQVTRVYVLSYEAVQHHDSNKSRTIDHRRFTDGRCEHHPGARRKFTAEIRTLREANRLSELEVLEVAEIRAHSSDRSNRHGVRLANVSLLDVEQSCFYGDSANCSAQRRAEGYLEGSGEHARSSGAGRVVYGRWEFPSIVGIHSNLFLYPLRSESGLQTHRGAGVPPDHHGYLQGPDIEIPGQRGEALRETYQPIRHPRDAVQGRNGYANADRLSINGNQSATRGNSMSAMRQEFSPGRFQGGLQQGMHDGVVAAVPTKVAQSRARQNEKRLQCDLFCLQKRVHGYDDRKNSKAGMSALHPQEDWPVQTDEEWVYCLDVDETHNFFAGGVCVHNCQDMSAAEWDLVDKLASAGTFCVGDRDQSIFEWRGGRPDLMLKFGKEADQLFSLPLTYRFGAPIADPANRMIVNNTERFEGIIVPANAGLQSSVWTVRDCEWGRFAGMVKKEVDARGPENVVVLGRTHAVLADAGDALDQVGVAVYRSNAESELLKTSEARAAKGYVRLAVNPRDRRAFMAVAMCEGLSMPALWDIRSKAADTGCSLLEAYGKSVPATWQEIIAKLRGMTVMYSLAAQYIEGVVERENPQTMQELALAMQLETVQDRMAGQKRPAVTLATIHSTKGQEWPCVFIIGMNGKTFPSRRSMSEGRIAEERNLCYVAVTRAKEALYVVHQKEDADPIESVFIKELGL